MKDINFFINSIVAIKHQVRKVEEYGCHQNDEEVLFADVQGTEFLLDMLVHQVILSAVVPLLNDFYNFFATIGESCKALEALHVLSVYWFLKYLSKALFNFGSRKSDFFNFKSEFEYVHLRFLEQLNCRLQVSD